MKRGNNPEILKIDGKFQGFNLGADFVSEHEWGIDKIKYIFGIDQPSDKTSPLLGADKRTISKFPEKYMHFQEFTIQNKKYWALICAHRYDINNKLGVNSLRSYSIYPCFKEEHIFSAWDESGFAILVDKEYKVELKELFDEFKKCNVMITQGGGHVFSNGGLLLLIRSSLTKEELDRMYAIDIDHLNLEKAVEESGIKEILKAAGKDYYALSPRWKDESKTEIRFWLNPSKQQLYNYGWYTIEELKLWAEDNPQSTIIKANKVEKTAPP
jgi:hypothetical protein